MSREKVTSVIDGDTFKTSKGSVRLANVEAPEKGTARGNKATQELKNLVAGKTVNIETVGRSYGRRVADVSVDGKSVNRSMSARLKKS